MITVPTFLRIKLALGSILWWKIKNKVLWLGLRGPIMLGKQMSSYSDVGNDLSPPTIGIKRFECTSFASAPLSYIPDQPNASRSRPCAPTAYTDGLPLPFRSPPERRQTRAAPTSVSRHSGVQNRSCRRILILREISTGQTGASPSATLRRG